MPVLNSFYPNLVDPNSVIDTLVCSRLFNAGIEGGHSIEAWGERLGKEKLHGDLTSEDFLLYSPKVLERCIRDTLVNALLFNFFRKYIFNNSFTSALRTEHNISLVCKELTNNGFPFNEESAKVLLSSLCLRLKDLDNLLKEAFPPKEVLKKVITPRITKDGTVFATDLRRLLAAGYNATDIDPDRDYPIYETVEFNPSSLKQIIERLNDAGWKPTEKTKGHAEATQVRRRIQGKQSYSEEKLEKFREFGWKLSEDNLRTLPDSAPKAAHSLVERLLLAGRVSDLEEYLNLCTLLPSGSRGIQAQFDGIGAWTQRMTTRGPNLQNIPVPQHKDNPSALDILADETAAEMRRLFYAPKGYRLIGTDADGIQMRIFAHYVNDKRLIEALIKGDKSLGTDIHSLHRTALGAACKGRNPAKTFIYAWLLGAGTAKVSEILECSFEEAKTAISNFLGFYPGLSELKGNRIPSDAARGYFEGLDKRLVVCSDAHKMLGGYLQNGEAVIMKRACLQWREECKKYKLPFWQVNFVHDEWQTMTYDDDDLCNEISRIQIKSIVDQGVQLSLNCPLGANSRFGYNWLETH